MALITRRVEGDFLQKDLAERAGIAVGTLNRIEAGRAQPRATTIRKLALALGCDITDITYAECA